ncbi:MAG: peptidoglycan bridge formation peptidyltransferase VanK-I [Solirubrobacteraceae bacterium]
MTALRTTISEAPAQPEWDEFVAHTPGGHHVQSTMWAEVKALLGWRARRAVVSRGGTVVAGCQVLLRSLGPATLAYVPRGPLAAARDHEAMAAALDGALEIAGSSRLAYLKLQPPTDRSDLEPELVRRGFAASDLEAAPTATVLVDLRLEPDAIMARMRSSVRANIRKAQRKGITIRHGGPADMMLFGELVRATGTRQDFAAYPTSYYERMYALFTASGEACLLLAEHEGRVLSALLLIGFGDTAAYKMGGWSGERSSIRPNELAHWVGMQWARERGFRFYDFEGFPPAVARALRRDEDPAGAKGGTARFKLGFGGDVYLFPGAYDTSPSGLLRPLVRRAAPRLSRARNVAHRALGRG